MSGHREKLQLIQSYLEEEFAGHTVTAVRLPASPEPGFAVERAGRRYELRVDGDFLDEHPASEIRALLGEWKLRDELPRRGLGRDPDAARNQTGVHN